MFEESRDVTFSGNFETPKRLNRRILLETALWVNPRAQLTLPRGAVSDFGFVELKRNSGECDAPALERARLLPSLRSPVEPMQLTHKARQEPRTPIFSTIPPHLRSTTNRGAGRSCISEGFATFYSLHGGMDRLVPRRRHGHQCASCLRREFLLHFITRGCRHVARTGIWAVRSGAGNTDYV